MIRHAKTVLPPIIAVLFLLGLNSCKSGTEHAQKTGTELTAAPVTVITAEQSTPPRQVEIMGTVRAADSALIAARISGNIQELPVSVSSRVKKGDLLVSISAREISAKLLQARTQYEQASRNLKREQNLLKKQAATEESVKTLAESQRIAEAALVEARTMLNYTTIEAPFAGIITQKYANIGDLATPGKPLLKLESESNLEIVADIPEALIRSINLKDKVAVYIPSLELNIEGTVIEIAPSADPQSRTTPVKFAVGHQSSIRSGQFARIFLPGSHGKAIMVPRSALVPFGQIDRLYIVKDGKARTQLVTTGLTFKDRIEILSGVTTGDEIIVSNNKHLTDGQPVTIQ